MKDYQKYILKLFTDAGPYNVIWIPDHLDYIRKTYNVADKQIYYTLDKFNKKRILNYGTSLNGCWLEPTNI